MLEAALIMQPQQQDTGQRPPVGNAGLSPQEINTHMKELDRQLCLDHDKKKELNEKVSVQKAQLESLIMENQVVHLALSELQQEVQRLTKQLRKGFPNLPKQRREISKASWLEW